MTAIERFQTEYQEYHDISAGRRQAQIKAITDMAALAGKAPEDCDPDDIRAYLASLTARGLHVNTVRKHLNMVKPFFNWLWTARLIDAEKLLEVREVKAPRKSSGKSVPRPYSRKELDRFWDEFDRAWPRVDDKFWARWKRGTSPYRRVAPHAMRIQIEAIVALALHCGMRRSEIFNASLDDIHYDNAYVVVRHAKGDNNGEKMREVPHTATSRAAVKAWIEVRALMKPKHDFPWLSLAWDEVKGTKMRQTRFEHLLLTIGNWQLHRFRHTAGTEWLRSTRRIEIVQKLLGHATLTQTLAYARLVRDDLHDAVAKSELEFKKAVGAR